jgi:hypothetical protein
MRKGYTTMRKIAALLALVTALVTALTISPAATSAPPPRATVAPIDVTGVTDAGATFAGELTNIEFVNQNGSLAVTGLLSGTLTSATGVVLGTVEDLAVTLPVTGAQAGPSCEILDLTLGPLDLDLLGLVVHLDTVHLNITAVPGAGNLLGNLLCAVAGLLDGTGGGFLANLLNRLLGL